MAVKKSTKEFQEEFIAKLRHWQQIEDTSVESTARIIEKTDHPLLKLVMEIIQSDSKMHFRVQQLIVESLEVKPVTLRPEDMTEVWESINDHMELEERMVGLVEETLSEVKKRKLLVPEYLLNYLYTDELKHRSLLLLLEEVKKGMYPYG
jgi:hypothetical protein